jgi:hypothetical protein
LIRQYQAEVKRLRATLNAHHDFNHPDYLCAACQP